jgi:hypothetical protein
MLADSPAKSTSRVRIERRVLHARQAIAALAPAHATLVGIGRVARPEPVSRALSVVQDGLGPVGTNSARLTVILT